MYKGFLRKHKFTNTYVKTFDSFLTPQGLQLRAKGKDKTKETKLTMKMTKKIRVLTVAPSGDSMLPVSF